MSLSRIGLFSLEERLGDKGSTVQRAIHLQQRKQVVLKLFAVPFGATEHAGSEFVEEMNLLRQLVHPNIVRCFGGKIEDSTGYTCSELIDGETLAELLERKGRLPWDQALEYAKEIAAALQAAGEFELMHQDLVPDKLLLAKGGQLKVADFRRDRVNNPWCFSARKRTLARLTYQSPEQIRGGRQLTPKTDLYSLGCLLFHMLTGRPPFVASSPDELKQQQLEMAPPRVCAVALDCPVWLDALIAQLLEKDPRRRPHSAAAVLIALEEAKKKGLSGASVTEHALGGFSSLRLPIDKQEARELVSGRRARRTRDDDAHDGPPFWEKPWFLAVSLIALLSVLGAGLSFALRPLTEQQLIDRAEKLMASDNSVDWRQADDMYLQPLLKRFPHSDYIPKAKEHLDTIAMNQAENHARTLQRMGRTPSHEGERLYTDAKRYEEFGDRVTALDKYQGMVSVLSEEGEDRPFVLLAKRRLAALTEDKSTAAEGRAELVKQKLTEAATLADQGKLLEARKIWYGLNALYGHNAELAPLIAEARERLASPAKAGTDHTERGGPATGTSPRPDNP
jgi:serine/threonine protein kinase